MAPLSLKIILEEGVVCRTILFSTSTTVSEAHEIVLEKFHNSLNQEKAYGLFLTAVDDEKSGIWLESHRTLDYYMLRDGDSLQYLCKTRNLRVRMLDGSVKTLQVDESKVVGELLFQICSKIGITNHDEYGFCRDEHIESEETKSSTGTLTLKRKIQKDKDVKLEQLSKKLNTDDNVEWLNQMNTLRELKVDPTETLLLKRRLFYSDRKIDARDPVQLNLLYVQTRDNILSGRQVTTEEKAIEFAGIQCQVHFGDFEEDKHKPGFIENLAEYLPKAYVSSWGIEKKIYREYRKHIGVSQLDAKYLYTKIAREHPTYGVTFFLVKEQEKGKKKMVPRLLGINANSILRLDENTKEILKVWLLTQVKSYHAGKSTFTLNFGDYSDKEYAVKTNEAFRIRDILEGYIDIIRKKVAGPFKKSYVEGQAICEDNVEKSKGTLIQNVVPQKVVEHCFVGPSQIISHQIDHEVRQGTQIVTVQQMIVTKKGDMKQQAMSGMAGCMPVDFNRRINHLNSQSVKAVMLLGDPSRGNLDQVRTIGDDFEVELPAIIKGVEELANLQTSEEDKKKLLDDLEQIRKYLLEFSASTKSNDLAAPENIEKAEETAKKIAELSSLILLSSDPKIKRRSQLLRRSRDSFIEDERIEATLRRASFLTVTSSACKAVQQAVEDLNKPYSGESVSNVDAVNLKSSAADKLAKLNAAVALLLAARADPKKTDYETAVNSMSTINELTPSLIKDAKALSTIQDGGKHLDLLNQINALCQSLNSLCNLSGSNEDSELKDAANEYAKTSGKLIYVFNPKGHGRKSQTTSDVDKGNEIIALAREIKDRTNGILVITSDLTKHDVNDPHAQALNDVGGKCADAASGLLVCSKITAPTIHEPHCQSALTAAVENYTSSLQQLSSSWKPLVEDPQYKKYGKALHEETLNLTKTLERLKKAYENLNGDGKPKLQPKPVSKDKNAKRLQFVTSLSAAKHSVEEMARDLQDGKNDFYGKPIIDEDNKKRLRLLLAQKIAQMNAAVASLVYATCDRESPDYETAMVAIDTINELNPQIIKDTKDLCRYENDKTRNALLEEVATLCKATHGICVSAEKNNPQDMYDAASNFADSSGKLCYVFNPKANPEKENQILDLSRSACEKASEMLSKVYQLTEAVGGEDGSKLDTAGTKVVSAAQGLLTVAQITSPSIRDERCKSALISSANTVSNLTQDVASLWEPLLRNPEYHALGDQLNKDREILETLLEKLKKACESELEAVEEMDKSKTKEKQRLKFVITTTAAKNNLVEAEKLLQDTKDIVVPQKLSKDTSAYKDLQGLTAQKLAELNAVTAALMRATSDTSNIDYETAESAVTKISQLTPDIIQNANKLCHYLDEKQRVAMLDNVKSLCKANKLICESLDKNDMKELSNAANKFVNSSGKLCYTFNPRANSMKENQILDLSKEACENTSLMLSRVYELAEKEGGEEGSRLDTSGAKVVDAAQVLLSTAQITAASISDPRCQSELIKSADTVSNLTQDLASIWEPIIRNPVHRALGDQIVLDRKILEESLNKLKKACRSNKDKAENINNITEKQRLKFVQTTSGARNKISEAEKYLKDNSNIIAQTKKLNKNTPEYKELQRLSAQKLAELNAAVAAVMQATSDSVEPDYKKAETAILAVSQLTPEIVQNTSKLSEYEDEKPRREMLEHVKALCGANQFLCDSLEKNDVKDLKAAADKFANSSGKLYYVFDPRPILSVENQVIDVSRSACQKASEMLSKVYQLAEAVGGEDGSKLESSGTRVVNAAQGLLTVAQITAPSIRDERCKSALIKSANTISNAAQDVASIWEPILQNPKYHALGDQLNTDKESLEALLEKLKQAWEPELQNVDEVGDNLKEREKQRLTFIMTTTAAKKNLAEAEKLLQNSKDTARTQKLSKDTPGYKDLQGLTAQKLAELNAAIAALMRATSDTSNVDYVTAENALKLISEITPDIIRNTNKLCQYEDEKQCLTMLDNVKSLYKANKLICDTLDKNDMQELKAAANNYVNSLGQLCYTFNPLADSIQENQILDLSREACENTSLMLSRVYELAEKVGGEEGSRLDTLGAKVVDAAQVLLSTAQITAVSISDPRCQSELIKSADTVSIRTQDVASIWEPIIQNPEYRALGDQIVVNRRNLEEVLDKLKNACRSDYDTTEQIDSSTKKQQVKCIQTASGAKKKISEAEKYLHDNSDVLMQTKKLNKNTPEYKEMQRLSEQKLAELNAAIAAVMQATSDLAEPDYKRAETALLAISQLTPEIVQNTSKLCHYEDEKPRRDMLEQARSLCVANQLMCDSFEKNDVKDLIAAVDKFASSSGKLYYVFDPRAVPLVKDQIVQLSNVASAKTRDILSSVKLLSENIGGEEAHSLKNTGNRLVNAAEILLNTAKITAPSIADSRCQSELMSSTDLVSKLDGELASKWEPLVCSSPLDVNQPLGDKLEEDREILETTLRKLKDASNPQSDLVKLLVTISGAKEKLAEAEKVLTENDPSIMASDEMNEDNLEYKKLQRVLAQKLADLNASMANLVRANSDSRNPDLETTEKEILKISQLTPELVQNTKKLTGYVKSKQRQEMLDNVNEICKSNKLLYENLEKSDSEGLANAASKFAKCSEKLYHEFNPPSVGKSTKENLLIDLSKAVHEKVSGMLFVVEQLSESFGGESASQLDKAAVRVAHTAQELTVNTKITAPSIEDARCQAVIVASAKTLSSHVEDLCSKWTPILQNPNYTDFGEKLSKDKKDLHGMVEKFITECTVKPGKPSKPDPPVRQTAGSNEDKLKTKHVQFCKSADLTQNIIRKAEEDLKKPDTTNSTRPLIVGAQEKLQNLIVNNLASAGVAVSHLISDMGPDHVNYDNAIKATKVLTELIPVIVKDGKEFSNTKEDTARQKFLNDMLSLCEVSTKLCESAKGNSKDINDIAVEFGNKAAKLVYDVSAEVHPNQEKEVIRRAREIGDSTSRLVIRGAEGALEEKDAWAHALSAAATRCADSARDFMYTAKLVAPTIHCPESRRALLEVSKDLTSKIKEYSLAWQPLYSNKRHSVFVKDLDTESELLRNFLENFNQDLINDRLVKRREVEKLVIQDTPLRQLASNLLETVKTKAELTDSSEDKRNYLDYSNKLAAAIRDMDVANAKSRNAPHDKQRREELEEAVQHLQQVCLESRIQSGQEKQFVDLMDLINDVSSDAKILSEETMKVKPEYNKYALITIKNQADDIIKAASETAHPPGLGNDGEVIDGTLIIKQFAQKFDESVDTMRVAVEEIRDVPSQKILRSKLMNLKGSSDLLRFAVNSHIAAVRTATLEANQADFEELEKSIDSVLQTTRKRKNPNNRTETISAGLATATTLCSAVSSQNAAEKIPPALTVYLLETRSGNNLADPKAKFRLEEHLKKLLGLLKTHTMARSRQIATWQETDQGEVNDITCQIIQEIENYNKEGNDGVQKRTDGKFLNENDLKMLLLPSTQTICGDPKQINSKFHQQLEKLSSVTGMVQLEFSKNEPLKSLHKVAGVAIELRAFARAVAAADPIKRLCIEDATDAMCFTTYHFLKTAETASNDRRNPDSHRKFNEAMRLMNEAIGKLGQLNKPKDKLKSDCAEIVRNLQLQLSLLQTEYPPNMMAYATCLEPLQNQNNLHSIQNEDPMSREECSASLQYLSSMICHSAEFAGQCGYLLSLPDEYQHIAKDGFLNVPRILNITSELRLDCFKIIRSKDIEETNYIQSNINRQVIELHEVIQEAVPKLRDPKVKQEVLEGIQEIDQANKNLRDTLRESPDMKTVIPLASKLLDVTEDFTSVLSQIAVLPQARSTNHKVRSEEVISKAKTLLTKTQTLVNTVASSNFEVLTWKMFEGDRNGLIKSYEQFVNCIAENGRRAGFIEGKAEEHNTAETSIEPKKAFIEIQYDLARKWLTKPASKAEDKSAGIEGVKNIINLAEKMSEDVTGEEKSDLQGMIDETKILLDDCTKKYNSEKASLLLERLRELQSMLKWRVVTRVVEDFLEEEPLADLELLVEIETDDHKRKFILDKKVAELLAQLGRMTKTARFVADAGSGAADRELLQAKDQMELLAPALVKAAQHRIQNPNNKEAIETYTRFLTQYSELMSRLRDICDRSVDPMEFAQAAGETIQRIREESTVKSDPKTCANTSSAITRLGRRVIEAGMNSQEAQNDPELKQALAQAQSRLAATTKVQHRSSRAPDWRDITAEILRTTGEVESFLGGENIFQKQPEPDQPIYAAALDLHAAVREWSARDNEIVAVAKRMAVQMARLSDYMNTDRKFELLNTSKDIVASSRQVAALARKLALECTDMRIRTNLMQVCEQIPTISGQLKMLITVKGSSMGGQGTQESREAMDTLVSNAKNLMASIQEVVKAAIGASVKIMSQRGLRMKWVRRVCYNY